MDNTTGLLTITEQQYKYALASVRFSLQTHYL
jgi:hypothetical protein